MRSRAIIDEETRVFKVTLNKLAPTNYEKLSEELRKMIKPDLIEDLSQLILDRASVEVKFLPLYANLSRDLSRDCGEFKRRLLETCQDYYEQHAKTVDKKPSDKKKLLGCLRFIGQLNKIKLLSDKVIIRCIDDLLDGGEDCIEGACHLMSSCSELFTLSRYETEARKWMEKLKEMRTSLSSRVRFMVLDLEEARELKLHALEKSEAPGVVTRLN